MENTNALIAQKSLEEKIASWTMLCPSCQSPVGITSKGLLRAYFVEKNNYKCCVEFVTELRRMEKIMNDESKMNKAATGGLRDNKGKPRLSLVPACLEEGVAEVIYRSSKEGGGKYPMNNWRKGLPWSEVAESAMRHIKAFASKGEDFDKETGLHHLKHAACNIAFLLEYLNTCPDLDDRYKPEEKK